MECQRPVGSDQRGDGGGGGGSPTVSVTVSAPATHDGSSEFTFDIEFSEEFGLSYRTLRFHAFNVTGGTVEKAQRMDKPNNISWRITVRPTSTGGVVIELPVTTDCNAEGAICTGDGRKLSNSLNLTVSGPGGWERWAADSTTGRINGWPGGAVSPPGHSHYAAAAETAAPRASRHRAAPTATRLPLLRLE